MQNTTISPNVPASELAAMPRIPVGPVAVTAGDLRGIAAAILHDVRAGHGARVATANLDFVARARRDAVLAADLADSDVVTADGAPVAWLARLASGNRIERVTGVDLVAELCRQGATDGLRVAFYGSEETIARKAAARLEAEYPGVKVVSIICPPFRPLTEGELTAHMVELNATVPDLVLVALGCPRQERFIAAHHHVAPAAAWVGVGGTFDFYAGKRTRAPRLAQRVGGEWLVRLAQEPRRLWRRYLVDDIPALVAVGTRVVGGRLRSRSALS
ncbi:MAG: WecB/TagA/CpsF family glycosyltransferase [Dehalococcoidia bacterium]|nr:WecB/TagA/CpsF family glycosyltransferase [Dehalococcoidia bacterium]